MDHMGQRRKFSNGRRRNILPLSTPSHPFIETNTHHLFSCVLHFSYHSPLCENVEVTCPYSYQYERESKGGSHIFQRNKGSNYPIFHALESGKCEYHLRGS